MDLKDSATRADPDQAVGIRRLVKVYASRSRLERLNNVVVAMDTQASVLFRIIWLRESVPSDVHVHNIPKN